MAKSYNVGDRLYLPVWITNKESNFVAMNRDNNELVTDAKFSYVYSQGETRSGEVRYGEPSLLLTAEDIAMVINTERDDALEELKSRNAELEALLKEVMATRDEAIKQNNELIADRNNWKEAAQRYHDNAKVADAATDNLRKENRELKAKVAELIVENDNLKSDCNEWKDTANERLNAVQTLSAERNKVMAGVDELKNTLVDRTKDVQHLTEENANLKAWYEEANKTATEAAEANDELKVKIADLRNRVGEQLAQIQDLNAEVHFHKEFGEGLDKQHKELQARYDELDSVNKEQAEKIRKLDKALTDLKKRNDDLQAENTNLTFLLEDAPEKETTKTLHVVLNDGTEIEFRRYTAYDYRTDINMFVVKDSEKYIAGFLRGDKAMNLAYWWTE